MSHSGGGHWLRHICVCVVAAFILTSSLTAAAEDRTALLQTGKKTLYQRVLSRPKADIFDAPEGKKLDQVIPPFTPLFVYTRQTVNNAEWVEVGNAQTGKTLGWLKGDSTIEWRQAMTVAFTNPASRDPALLFRGEKEIKSVLTAPDPKKQLAGFRTTISSKTIPPNFPVVSVEPSTYVDFSKRFYLLPILDAQEISIGAGFSTRLLKIASVTASETAEKRDNPDAPKAAAAPPAEGELKAYNVALVFVLDTTRSMDPYIARTRKAAENIATATAANPDLKGKVSFGIVGFRNNIKMTPKLEYLTKVFLDPKDGGDVNAFIHRLGDVSATTVSSHSWDEDSLAGVMAGVTSVDWNAYAGRYIIVITDAAGLKAADPAGSTHLDAEQVRQLALEKHIATFVMHLKTPGGKADHAGAAAQYKALTDFPNLGPLYYPVEGGSVDDYGKALDTFVQTITQQIAKAAQGKLTSTQNAGTPGSIEQQADMIGRAMELSYLGVAEGTEAPSLFEAWTTDRDIVSPQQSTLEVRVLLTKAQLSDLQQTLKSIVDAGKAAQLAPQDFLKQLRSAAAAMSRNPADVAKQKSRKLADTGLLGEYLDDLPYKSKVMNIDQDLWEAWSISEQQQFIDELEAKIRLYQKFNEDTDHWVNLGTKTTASDAVYPIPLDSLP